VPPPLILTLSQAWKRTAESRLTSRRLGILLRELQTIGTRLEQSPQLPALFGIEPAQHSLFHCLHDAMTFSNSPCT
jgi:hypothetical protein